MPSAKPVKPPSGADFSAMVKKINELAGKIPGVSPLNATITGRIPLWKRWVGGEKEYLSADAGGLYPVIKANAQYLDTVKGALDTLDEREAAHHAAQALRLTALEEAVQNPPFPG